MSGYIDYVHQCAKKQTNCDLDDFLFGIAIGLFQEFVARHLEIIANVLLKEIEPEARYEQINNLHELAEASEEFAQFRRDKAGQERLIYPDPKGI